MLKKCVVFNFCYNKVICSKDKLRKRAYYDEIDSKNKAKTDRTLTRTLIYVCKRQKRKRAGENRANFLLFSYSIL